MLWIICIAMINTLLILPVILSLFGPCLEVSPVFTSDLFLKSQIISFKKMILKESLPNFNFTKIILLSFNIKKHLYITVNFRTLHDVRDNEKNIPFSNLVQFRLFIF